MFKYRIDEEQRKRWAVQRIRCFHSKKGAYFYVIDAFVAGIIIIGTIVALYARFFSSQSPTQPFYSGEDLLSAMESTQASSYDDDLVRAWVANGTIDAQPRTLLQQLAYFSKNYGNDTANPPSQLCGIVVKRTPKNIGITIKMDGTPYYERGPAGSDVTITTAATMLSAKRLVVQPPSNALINDPSLNTPALVEVFTWQ